MEKNANLPKLGIYKLDQSFEGPKKSTLGAACFDVAFQTTDGVIQYYDKHNSPMERELRGNTLRFMPGDRILVPTGLIFDIPEGYHLKVHVRSSTGIKKGLCLAHSTGIIDWDYTGQLYMPLMMNSSDDVSGVDIERGERLCQIELVKSEDYKLKHLKEPPGQKTDRVLGDAGGLGSTGDK